MRKRIKMDVIAEGEVDINDLDGTSTLYLRKGEPQLLTKIIRKCHECSQIELDEKTHLAYLLLQLERIVERSV